MAGLWANFKINLKVLPVKFQSLEKILLSGDSASNVGPLSFVVLFPFRDKVLMLPLHLIDLANK